MSLSALHIHQSGQLPRQIDRRLVRYRQKSQVPQLEYHKDSTSRYAPTTAVAHKRRRSISSARRRRKNKLRRTETLQNKKKGQSGSNVEERWCDISGPSWRTKHQRRNRLHRPEKMGLAIFQTSASLELFQIWMKLLILRILLGIEMCLEFIILLIWISLN